MSEDVCHAFEWHGSTLAEHTRLALAQFPPSSTWLISLGWLGWSSW
jgi:hypothetical protein